MNEALGERGPSRPGRTDPPGGGPAGQRDQAKLRGSDPFGGLRYDGRTGARGNQDQHGLQVGGLLEYAGMAAEFGVQDVDLSGQTGPS
ncbi:hypothetical protein GCM10009743_60190 [Kribbella swartbergensis]